MKEMKGEKLEKGGECNGGESNNNKKKKKSKEVKERGKKSEWEECKDNRNFFCRSKLGVK